MTGALPWWKPDETVRKLLTDFRTFWPLIVSVIVADWFVDLTWTLWAHFIAVSSIGIALYLMFYWLITTALSNSKRVSLGWISLLSLCLAASFGVYYFFLPQNNAVTLYASFFFAGVFLTLPLNTFTDKRLSAIP